MLTHPLIEAAQLGQTTKVKKLLDKGGTEVNTAAVDHEGRTAIHHAALKNHMEIVDLLLNHAKGGVQLLLRRDAINCTPIHLAGVQNQISLVVQMLQALLKDTAGTTPLHESARLNCLQDFMGYLHLGWSVGPSLDEDSSPLLSEEQGPLWQTVLDAEPDFQRKGLRRIATTMAWTPLHAVAMKGNVTLIKSLVTSHKALLLQAAANSWTPLHYAAAYDKVEAMELLIQLGCPPNVPDQLGLTPMHVAASEGHLRAVKLLLAQGCSVKDAGRGEKCTPLYCAAAWRRIEMVRYLHSLGCPAVPLGLENHNRTPVHVAAEQGWADLLNVLVEELHLKVDATDQGKFTPLHSAASGGHPELIRALLDYKHPLDVKEANGRGPLHFAAMNGRVEAAEELIRRGASPSARDAHSYTPLLLAAEHGHCQLIELLVKHGANPEEALKDSWTPLALATCKGAAHVEAIGTLVKLGAKVKPVLSIPGLETPLHVASRCGREDVVRRLVAAGVPVAVKTKDGSTALHYAAAFGQAHMVKTLVSLGCDVNVRDDANNTPLHLAAGCGFLETVEQLAHAGADLDARDVTSCTPLQNAAHGTYSAMAAPPSPPKALPTAGGKDGHGSLGNPPSQPDGKGYAMAAPAAGKAKNGGAGLSHAKGQESLAVRTLTELALKSTSPPATGRVPVRTGLAWTTFAAAGMQNATGLLPSFPPELDIDLTHDLRRTHVSSLLPKAASRPQSAVGSGSSWKTAPSQLLSQLETLPLQQRMMHHYSERGDSGLDALLQQTQALKLVNSDQNRTRLIAVAERLVSLGASVSAKDSEGRTAMHLAAGCGDEPMVLKLLELGTDINCRDSVGGTAMHHAAMANKKDMMVTLARLGCHWGTRAEGIDGATASFVFCGQHGKKNMMQAKKMMDLRLKRAYLDGEKLRLAGKNLLAAPTEVEETRSTVDSAAIADANAEELLKQEEDETLREAERKLKRRKKKKLAGEADSQGPSEDGGMVDSPPLHGSIPCPSGGATSSVGILMPEEAAPVSPIARGDGDGHAAASVGKHVVDANGKLQETASEVRSAGDDASRGPPKGSKLPDMVSGSSRATPSPPAKVNGHLALGEGVKSNGVRKDVSEDVSEISETDVRSIEKENLDTACALANSMTELGTTATEADIEGVLKQLNEAIASAEESKVSAKYGKKCRKKLLGLLEALKRPELAMAEPPVAKEGSVCIGSPPPHSSKPLVKFNKETDTVETSSLSSPAASPAARATPKESQVVRPPLPPTAPQAAPRVRVVPAAHAVPPPPPRAHLASRKEGAGRHGNPALGSGLSSGAPAAQAEHTRAWGQPREVQASSQFGVASHVQSAVTLHPATVPFQFTPVSHQPSLHATQLAAPAESQAPAPPAWGPVPSTVPIASRPPGAAPVWDLPQTPQPAQAYPPMPLQQPAAGELEMLQLLPKDLLDGSEDDVGTARAGLAGWPGAMQAHLAQPLSGPQGVFQATQQSGTGALPQGLYSFGHQIPQDGSQAYNLPPTMYSGVGTGPVTPMQPVHNAQAGLQGSGAGMAGFPSYSQAYAPPDTVLGHGQYQQAPPQTHVQALGQHQQQQQSHHYLAPGSGGTGQGHVGAVEYGYQGGRVGTHNSTGAGTWGSNPGYFGVGGQDAFGGPRHALHPQPQHYEQGLAQSQQAWGRH